jgi:hypothetical protein
MHLSVAASQNPWAYATFLAQVLIRLNEPDVNHLVTVQEDCL